MRLKTATLQGFKRFHHLVIDDIPETIRLVVITGPNGSGKSSLFDAFAFWYGFHRDWGNFDNTYHVKAGLPQKQWGETVSITFHEPTPTDPTERKKMFYIRSAYRNEAEFSISAFGRPSPPLDDGRRVKRMIDNDIHVSDNYQRLVAATIASVYDPRFDTMQVKEMRERLIGKVRQSMGRVFDNLVLSGTGDPIENGSFYFDKGSSRDFHYKNLSGGEKGAFDLLLDLVVKCESYDNTIFCIDEPDQHMHTRTQGKLLEELFNQIPTRCQLWISTHSVGMMRKARELYLSQPGEVAFLDFGDLNFDADARISPSVPNRAFWQKALAVALDDLAGLVAPAQVVLCEGKPPTASNPIRAEFDAACLRTIFSQEKHDTDFISVGNAFDVQTDRLAASKIVRMLVSGTTVIRVIDRDDRSKVEITQLNADGVRVLSRRHLESFLLDDEVLTALCAQSGKLEKAKDLRNGGGMKSSALWA